MSELKITEKCPMSAHTTFRCGGPADRFVTVENVQELREALKLENPMIIGNGSNILFSDAGYRGTVIKLGGSFTDIKISGNTVTAGAGTSLALVSRIASTAGLAGMEFACGIPGSIGGGVFMNAGAYDGTIGGIIRSVSVLTPSGEEKEYEVCSADFSYRHSPMMDSGEIVLAASFELQPGDKKQIDAKIADFSQRRTSKQPLAYPSAGSFFKRPEGYFAGKLIEDAGLKGCSVGGAQVSELHAGFIINRGGATATDVLNLMHKVQAEVLEKFGVELHPEVRIIGE